MRKSLASVVGVIASVIGSAAFAQATITGPQLFPMTDPAATAPASAGLGEIVVTAQRRAENLQHAAIAVDVVSPKASHEQVSSPHRR